MDLADSPMSTVPSGEVIDGKILISDQANKFQYKTQPDCFIIDVDKDTFSTSNEISQNLKITRNLSRKGMIIIGGGNKMGDDHGAGDDTPKPVSPVEGAALGGPREELSGGGDGDGDGGVSHEIVIMSGAERLRLRRNSLKRPSQNCTWYLNPRNIFLFCATLSCLGTMVLTYLAFSSGMTNVQDTNLD